MRALYLIFFTISFSTVSPIFYFSSLFNAVCSNASIDLDVNGQATLQVADVDGGSTIPVNHSISVSPTAFDCSHVGTPQTVTLTVYDGGGGVQSMCTATVNIEDNLPPTLNCQTATNAFIASNGQATVAPFFLVNFPITDNCGNVTNPVTGTTFFDCNDIGSQTVIFTVDDNSGNPGTCQIAVTVIDNIPPSLDCQSSTTAALDANGQTIVAPFFLVNFPITDNCGNVTNPVTGATAFDCSHLGSQTVTFSVDDNSGNPGTCEVAVTVVDNIPPTLNCQSSTTAALDGNGQTVVAPFFLVNFPITDNCGNVTNPVTGATAFDCSDLGSQTVTFSVDDNSGNPGTCQIAVTVVDNIPPTLNCQASTTAFIGSNGQATVAPFFLVNFPITDNCGNITNPVTGTTFFNCNDIGSQTVIFSVDDNAGNPGTCEVAVTVVDNISPTVDCKSITHNVGLIGSTSISPSDVENTPSTDNCSISSLSVNPNSFSCLDAGPNTVTLTAIDASNNQSTCQATVTVVCGTVPVEFGTIRAIQTGKSALISWFTYREFNNDFFEIEHSKDGVAFSKVGSVNGGVIMNSKRNYKFQHEHPQHGFNYYRVLQVDLNGHKSNSETVVLNFKSLNNEIEVFPNPAKDILYLRGDLSIFESGSTIELFNLAGTKIYSSNATESLDLSHVSNGIYFLHVNSTRIQKTIKIVVSR